jgi:hypothetical protein
MAPVNPLIAYCLRQVVGGPAEPAADRIGRHLADPDRALARALSEANDRAWHALGLALAGEGLVAAPQGRGSWVAGGESAGPASEGPDADFRAACLAELLRARAEGALGCGDMTPAEVARCAAGFPRPAESAALIAGAQKVVGALAEELAPRYPGLAWLVRQCIPAGPPLLAAAFAYFFRAEAGAVGRLAGELALGNLAPLAGPLEHWLAEPRLAFGRSGPQPPEIPAPAGPGGGAKAEALFGRYREALEQRECWDAALADLLRAAELDPRRFEPFPLTRYRPRQILGAGGFGTAFLCHDRSAREPVVVKTLRCDDLERGPADIFHEAEVLRGLNHPAIIAVRGCGYADPAAQARPYLVLEYFPGGTLEAFVRQRGTLAPGHLAAVARQIALAVRAAHGQQVLHRDIKPANVLVRKEGERWRVKVIDFGLALRRQTLETIRATPPAANTVLAASVAGTLRYAPPEQLGELDAVPPGPYSDVYAFGKLCCYALFGTTEPKQRHWATVPTPLADLLERCTEQDLKDRLPDFEPVLAALDALGGPAAPGPAESSPAGDAEARLAQFLRGLVARTGGRFTPEERDAIKLLCRRYGVRVKRAKQLAVGIYEDWRRHQQAEADRRSREAERLRRDRQAAEAPRGGERGAHPGPVVCGQGLGTHRSLREALRGAAPGAEICVRPGVYGEAIVLDRPVRIVGDGPRDQVVIESDQATCLRMVADGAAVRGLTLRCRSVTGPAVAVTRGRLVLEDCTIISDSFVCVEVRGVASAPLLRHCTIQGGRSSGVWVCEQAGGTVEGCEFAGAGFAGVTIETGGDPVIRDCRIWDRMVGVHVVRQGRGTVEDCNICHNIRTAVRIETGGDPTVRRCRVAGNGEGVKGTAAVRVFNLGCATVEDCDLTGNRHGAWDIGPGCEVRRRGNKE